jgi:hypothetical protein
MLKFTGDTCASGASGACGAGAGEEASLVCAEDDGVCALFLSAVCFAAGRAGSAGAAFTAAAAAEASDIACVNPPEELGAAVSLGALALGAIVMGIEIRTLCVNATQKPKQEEFKK